MENPWLRSYMTNKEQKNVKNDSDIYENCRNCDGEGVVGIWICLKCGGKGKVVWTTNILKPGIILTTIDFKELFNYDHYNE